ncbi:hypothetical protein MMC07_008026 [Pseudocyphellaria aurata]|nr:hypothetical protein [Pseudocyphellaria aurata]
MTVVARLTRPRDSGEGWALGTSRGLSADKEVDIMETATHSRSSVVQSLSDLISFEFLTGRNTGDSASPTSSFGVASTVTITRRKGMPNAVPSSFLPLPPSAPRMAPSGSQEFVPDSQPSLRSTAPTVPGPPADKQLRGSNPHPSDATGHNSQFQGYHPYAPVIPRRRSHSPDELTEARAQLEALRGSRREDELAEIRKQIVKLQGADRLFKTRDEGMDPRILPLKARFSAVKPKYFHQVLDNDFDPVYIIRLCNDVSISKVHLKYIDLGKNLEVKMKDEDASESEIKGLATLIRCLGVYF